MNWEGYEVEGQMDISEFLDKGENMTENEVNMTENEKEVVKKLRNKAELFKNSGFAVDGIVKSFEDSANAIEMLSKEIQQYRAIGTVDEFKALKEKNIPKKRGIWKSGRTCCPNCERGVVTEDRFCSYCGQAIEIERD